MIRHWLVGLKMTSKAYRRASRRRQAWTPEGLEDRLLLSGNPTAYIVNLTSDTGAGSGNSGDLRYVITQANANTNTGGSVITFDPTVFASQQEINLTSPLELSEKDGPEVIDGPGSYNAVINGNQSVQDFIVDFGTNATLSDLVIANGSTGGPGGGINNDGTLAVVNCSIYGNYSAHDGGGIDNSRTLTITGSSIYGNSANGNGGGIYNAGMLTVTDSLIGGNTASNDGGGLENNSFNTSLTTYITNSTIDGNSAVDGGGIGNETPLTAVNTTITRNQADSMGTGGGLDIDGGAVTLDNTIVALNTLSDSTPSDIYGLVTSSSGFNLIGTGGSGGLVNGTNGNQVGVADPGLGLRGDGSVVPLLPGSPAIDRGSNALAVDPATGQPLTTDQRGAGFVRIANGTVDIGAYEVQPSQVANVVVKWGSSGSSALSVAADGLRLLPAGRNTDLPWLGINQIQITFNQTTTLTAADVTVQGIKHSYGPVTISGSGMNYTITLAQPITKADRVTITISGQGIVTFAGRMDVLPGDLTDDGVVNSKDVKGVHNQFKHKGGAMPTIFGDILGDGTVDARDNKAEGRLAGTKLPKLGGKVHKAVLARVLARHHTSVMSLFDRHRG